MNVENTSEDDVNFYASQATLITDTGEQLESDILFSEHIHGEFLGAVSKSGDSAYILKNGNAEDVQSVELRYSAATDMEAWHELGEEIVVEAELER